MDPSPALTSRPRGKRHLILVACFGLLATGFGGCYARAHTGAVVTAEYVSPRVHHPVRRHDERSRHHRHRH